MSRGIRLCSPLILQLSSVPNELIVRGWRKKLQRAFFPSNKALPDIELMPEMDTLFTSIEESQGITRLHIYTKIRKIMHHIHTRLEAKDVPRNSEFHFCTRAGKLLEKWVDEILDAEGSCTSSESARSPTTGIQ
ncbi:hypothetical protein R3P38DRAFT_3209877 [Favolaschia claudopus]|uniref:Uncharacterized protein n=1 Tax=Favolaschia claudopus TaxID=2862362 RepID=A0AAW0AHQ2_9AGAR